MVVETSANTFSYINGLLKRTLPNSDLGDIADRFLVGVDGGVCYNLFPTNFPRPHFNLNNPFCSLSDLRKISDYCNGTIGYINYAGEHAAKHKFGLIYVRGNGLIDITKHALFIFPSGIGDTVISSTERFDAFLEMVRSGREELGRKLAQVTILAREIR